MPTYVITIGHQKMDESNNFDDYYGYIIFGAGTKLMHTGINSFEQKSENKCLFCTLNTTRFGNDQEPIYEITLKKDMKYLFALKQIDCWFLKCVSALRDIFGDENEVNIKKDREKRKQYIELLKNNMYDGWFTVLDGGHWLEICLFVDDEFDETYVVRNVQLEDTKCNSENVTCFDDIIKNNTIIKNHNVGSKCMFVHEPKNIEKDIKKYIRRYHKDKKDMDYSVYDTFADYVLMMEKIIVPHLSEKLSMFKNIWTITKYDEFVKSDSEEYSDVDSE